MSGLLLAVCTRLLGLGPPLGAAPPRPPRPAMLAPFILLAALAEAAAAGPVAGLTGHMASPRMDFDEWTPLGHGDPLKNDPTYDYVPPVLDRVHYWMEESSQARRVDQLNVDLHNAVPVPATMLVPPPPPAATTPAPPPPGAAAALTGAPPSYSSLNPFHHFEDRPVVPNVLFEETPFGGFDAPPFAGGLRDTALTPSPSSHVLVQHQPLPLAGPTPLAPLPPPAGPPPLLPTPPAMPRPPSPNAIRAEPNKSSKLAPPAMPPPLPPRGPPPPPPPPKAPVKPMTRPPVKPTRHDDQPQLPPPPHLPPKQPPPPPQQPPPQMSTPPPSTTSTPRPTTTARPAVMTTSSTTTTASSISSLVRGLLHREAATTASTLTTDPLFAHYKQPVTPVHGPAYLIIQGHSKVKTYGPVLRRI